MTDVSVEDEATVEEAAAEKGNPSPQQELARALFAVLQAEEGRTPAVNREEFQEAWSSERRRMLGLARKILRRMERRGYSIQAK